MKIILLNLNNTHSNGNSNDNINYSSNDWGCLEVILDDDLDIADDQGEDPDHYEALVRVLNVGENDYCEDDGFLRKIYFILMYNISSVAKTILNIDWYLAPHIKL